MVRWQAAVVMAVVGVVVFTAACGRQTTVSPVDAGVIPSGQEADLPFERTAQKTGISPTSSVIPPGANIPPGTAIAVRLKSAISSARQRTGDQFEAVLDEPVMLNGEILAERGTIVIGRVIEARRAAHSTSPGYVRLVLISLPILGRTAPVQTSSAFLKGARASADFSRVSTEKRNGLLVAAAEGGKGAMLASDPRLRVGSLAKDVLVSPEHRLIFRLTEPLALPRQDD